MNKKIKQTSWEPGTEIESEAHYHDATENLAKKLISEHTTDELAVIAAQYTIYADTLERRVEDQNKVIHTKNETTTRLTLANEYLTKDTVAIVKTVLDAYSKTKWGKGGKARKVSAHKQRILDEWDETKSSYKSRADFAQIISRRDNLKERTLYDWIGAHKKLNT